ncbi:succinate dehydrogenase/fumarate reductase iron-sulfur subunit [Puniceicoccus vermicola]|uniref:Succinate dehydrogenase iron-sulfur subunit n=1 Tax=Puniceicoccus vermicola TaxID=388746 RepID=A0A7X1E6H6_9BACT|nr:succinate dehydrogenase/fumarate reductase iron-sulfur subunit [Puniceicoccus vermicola]MBC2604264.1 succinate dehydrogenase/fumarate reductase iron-sulfur subunit [Puniceicoccus vermicola]
MKLHLKIWRQKSANAAGGFESYELPDVSEGSSFLEMLDILNEQLVDKGEPPVAFDHDCREGICGMCSMVINGQPHGPEKATTACQLHMRHFKDGDTITIEPWRAKAFPVQKDLVVDRTAFDGIIQSGGFITARTGSAQDANLTPIGKEVADKAMDAAACIGCGACVAACPNGSAMLFAGAKVTHLNSLPQGKAERDRRVLGVVHAMDEAGFGNCTNYGECQEACPKEIKLDVIAKMNRDYALASVRSFFSKAG